MQIQQFTGTSRTGQTVGAKQGASALWTKTPGPSGSLVRSKTEARGGQEEERKVLVVGTLLMYKTQLSKNTST